MNREPPQAEITYQQNRIIRVICCYCQKEHRHVVYRHGTQRFAPHCGQYLTPEQRITGYTFTTKPPQKGKTERKNQ